MYRRNQNFVGRRDELLELAQQVKDGRHVAIAATGLGGIGKSQLAIEFVHRYGQFFAGGVYWVSMAQPEVVPTELAQCGARLGIAGIEEMPQPELVERVKQAWETPLPRLLIFDNCEDEALYAQYKPTTINCRILLTSRNGDWSSNVQMMPLRSLPRADSQALLTALCGRLTPEEADQIAAELGDYPLALHLAGSFLNRYKRLTVPKFLAELQSDTLQHQALRHHRGVGISPSGHDWDVARTFEISFNQLAAGRLPLAAGEEPTDTNDQKPAANRQPPTATTEIDTLALNLLARSAHFAPGEPIPVGLLWLTVEEEDEMALQEGVQRLVELGLLEDEEAEGDDGEQMVQMHRLLAQFVQGVTESEVAQADVEEALYLEAEKLNGTGYPSKLKPWVNHLKFVTDIAIERQSDKAAHLCNELGFHTKATGDYSATYPYYELAVTISKKLFGTSHSYTATNLNNLGALLDVQGDYEEARLYYEEALAIDREVLGERHPDTAIDLNNLGGLLRAQGDYEGAQLYYEEALSIWREVLGERHPDTALSIWWMAIYAERDGDLEKAKTMYEQAHAVFQETLGDAHHRTKNVKGWLDSLLAKMNL